MNWLSLLMKVLNLLLNKNVNQSETPPPITTTPTGPNWSDPESKVSENFTVHDCLWLPTWKRMANESDGLNDGVKSQLIELCKKMDKIRAVLNQPINVHCMYRPGPYSKLVGGSETDVHTFGMAIDFDCLPGLTCDQVKEKLMPLLETYSIRMENNGAGASWVHIDTHPVGNARFFNV